MFQIDCDEYIFRNYVNIRVLLTVEKVDFFLNNQQDALIIQIYSFNRSHPVVLYQYNIIIVRL